MRCNKIMNKKKISIYITNHNYGKYIERAIESALKQTYKNIEIIIVDDYSVDNSKNIIKKYKGKKNIKIIFNKSKLGLVQSSIKAIKVTTGNFILRLDADDYLVSNACETLISKIKNKSNVALIFPDFFKINESSNSILRYRYNHKKVYTLEDHPAHGACSLINKKIFMDIGGYNKLFDRQDGFYIWILILINKFKIIHCQKPLFYYRKHNKNLSNNLKKILKTRVNIINFFLRKESFYSSKLIRIKKKTIIKLNQSK